MLFDRVEKRMGPLYSSLPAVTSYTYLQEVPIAHGKAAAVVFLLVTVLTSSTAQPRRHGWDAKEKCKTADIGGDGVRHGCDENACHTVGPGQYIDEKTLKVTLYSCRGSDDVCCNEDPESITKVCVHVHARGPKGFFAGAGYAECSVSGVEDSFAKNMVGSTPLVSNITVA